MIERSDEEIVKELISGRGEVRSKAFSEIYEKYVNFVYDLGRTMGIPRSEIGDFVQEVFIKLFQKAKKFNTRKKFFPWFYSLVRNHCYDYLKRIKNKDSDLKVETYVNNPYEFEIELINQVRDIILRLSPKEREVIFLRYYQGLTPEEISKSLGYSTRNVYNILSRAMRKIEEEWKRE